MSLSVAQKQTSSMPNGCLSNVWKLLSLGAPVIQGNLDTMLQHRNCAACEMFTHIVKQIEGSESPETRYPDGNKVKYSISLRGGPVLEYELRGPQVLNVPVVLKTSEQDRPQHKSYAMKDFIKKNGYCFELQKGTREHTTADPNVNVFKRKGEGDDGAFAEDFLRIWLSAWIQVHPPVCRSRKLNSLSSEIDGLLLIDVHSMNVVDAPSNPFYLALSYVWGQSHWLKTNTNNLKKLREKQSLRRLGNRLPNTIQDAIELVRQLHERYLWVDSLCIIEDDASHKLHQIASMGAVYSGAQLVIVAAHGSDANAGLPGMRPHQYPRRVVRRRQYVHPKVRLLSWTPPVSDLIDSACWRTRGWTMQEAKVARLQLIFTTTHTILECECGDSCTENDALDVFHFNEDPVMLNPMREKIGLTEFWTEYCSLVQDYTSRNLSNERDVLAAFSAIELMCKDNWEQPCWFGIPKRQLGPSMMWKPQTISMKPFSRRQHTVAMMLSGSIVQCRLPSWSWLGWKGEIALDDQPLRNLMDLDGVDFAVTPTYQSSHRPIRPSNNESNPHLLIGEVWAAQFDLGPSDKHKDGSPHQGIPILHEGETIGQAILHPSNEWEPYISSHQSYTMIATCAFLTARFQRGSKEYGPLPLHRARERWFKIVSLMAVQFDESGIGERIGSGEVMWDDWMAAKPVKRSIKLG